MLMAVSHQQTRLQYRAFLADRTTVLFVYRLVSWDFNENIQVTISDAVTPQKAKPDCLGGPDNNAHSTRTGHLLSCNFVSYLGSSSMIILETEFQPVDASPLG